MKLSPKEIANNASFQAFMNCYIREIDNGVWHKPEDWHQKTGLRFRNDECDVLELQLDKLNTTLAIGICFRSLAGRHRFSSVYQQQQNQFSWQATDTLSTLLMLINNIYSDKPRNHHQSVLEPLFIKKSKLELISRTIESHQVMEHYISQRIDDGRLHCHDFISAEQSLLFGHWLHPTPKSRQGIHHWQHQHYTPELAAQFQLHFFEASRQLVRQASILEDSAEKIIQQIVLKDPLSATRLETLKADRVLLAVHPLQAQWLLHQSYVQQHIQQGNLKNLGPIGPMFTPTSSVRTLYCDQLDYMVKLSIPVKITNSLRINMYHELDAGMVMAKLLRHCDFLQRHDKFKMVDDPAYITLDLPGMQESGFETIIRENPFSTRSPDNSSSNSVQSIAAIVQEPLDLSMPSRLATLIYTLAEKERRSSVAVSLSWFNAYWECAIESAICLYDTQGIALEAHQQNSLLDVSTGYPSCYYYRDNQGFYLSKSMRKQLLLQEPELAKTEDLFYDDKMICDRFSYYLIINQLFSVINRFALDKLIGETQLLTLVYGKLQLLRPKMQGVGLAFIDSILNRREIPCKGNLLTRIDDLDELQVELELASYTQITNPLHNIHKYSATSNPGIEVDPREVRCESA